MLQVINGCTLEALFKKLEEGNLPPKVRDTFTCPPLSQCLVWSTSHIVLSVFWVSKCVYMYVICLYVCSLSHNPHPQHTHIRTLNTLTYNTHPPPHTHTHRRWSARRSRRRRTSPRASPSAAPTPSGTNEWMNVSYHTRFIIIMMWTHSKPWTESTTRDQPIQNHPPRYPLLHTNSSHHTIPPTNPTPPHPTPPHHHPFLLPSPQLRPPGLHGAGPGREPGHPARGGLPQFLQQALERHALRPDLRHRPGELLLCCLVCLLGLLGCWVAWLLRLLAYLLVCLVCWLGLFVWMVCLPPTGSFHVVHI
jgi:hypothetical protein